MKFISWFTVFLFRDHLTPIRHWVYKHGFRPKPGTILYSPSLAFIPPYLGVNPALTMYDEIKHMQDKIDEQINIKETHG